MGARTRFPASPKTTTERSERTMSDPGRKTTRRGGTSRWMAGLLALLLTTTACSDLLEVELPGKVPQTALDDPGLAQTLFNSVVGDSECAWTNYVAASAHHSDEFIQSSANAPMKRWGIRDITPDYNNYASGECEANYGLFLPLHTARVQADQNFVRIQDFPDEAVPGKPAMLAAMRGYSAQTLLAFGEGFCGTPLDGDGPTLTPAELLALAAERFTETMQLAVQAGADDIENMARVGRAKARLDLDDYPGAISDAEMVPAGFVFNAGRSQAPVRNQNAHYRLVNGPPNGDTGQRHGSVAPSYRDVQWKEVDDPRINASWDGAALGFDFSTAHWSHDKITSFDAPVMMASWREARMVIAEASALSGDLDRARAILNEFHTAAGIPPVTEADTPTQADVIAHVIEERRREFFVEGGHRLRDHLRWRGTEYEVPFLGEPGSDHPDGVDQNGDPYGSTTCFPVPVIEVAG